MIDILKCCLLLVVESGDNSNFIGHASDRGASIGDEFPGISDLERIPIEIQTGKIE